MSINSPVRVQHVDMINQHKVIPLLAKCYVEMAAFDICDITMHWEQQALYVEHEEEVIGAMCYEYLKHKKQTWIYAVFVVPEMRKRGIYRAMWDSLVSRSRKEGMISIAGGISPRNAPMIRAAESVGRVPESVCYRMDL